MSLRSLTVSGQVICPPPTQTHKALATPVALGNCTPRSWKISPTPHTRKWPGSPGLGGWVPTVSDPPEQCRMRGPTWDRGSFLLTSCPTWKESQHRSQSPLPRTGWLVPPLATSELRLLLTGVSQASKQLPSTEHTSELHVVLNPVCKLHCQNTMSRLQLILTKGRTGC